MWLTLLCVAFVDRLLLHQEIAAIKEQLDKEKKELLETTNMEAAEKDKISKELG